MPEPFRIAAPGIYTDMPSAAYFADPCPAPSLTQSIAKILIERSPLHAWHAHPRLNPDYRADDDSKFDVGNIAHKLLIGRGKEIVVLEFDDWRTKAAKEARDVAASAGKLGVLAKHYARSEKMVAAALEQLTLRGLSEFFQPGHGDGEVVVAWKEDNIWLRQMIDWLTTGQGTFVDFKTTDMSAAPSNLGRMMVNAGWHIQAAMAARGLEAVCGASRRRFLFVVQEAEPPYLLNVAEIGPDALTMGRKMLEYAVTRWKICVARNRWPGYPLEVVTPEYPGWAEQQWLDREVKEAASERRPQKIDPDILMAG